MKTGRTLMWIGYLVLLFEVVSYFLPIIENYFTWAPETLTWLGVLDGGLIQGLVLIGVGKLLLEQAKQS